MIYDRISNSELYSKACPRLADAVRFAMETAPGARSARYEMDGASMYASISEYTPGNGPLHPFEAHRKYIDVQILLEGKERIDITHLTNFQVKEEYSGEKDILFIHPPEEYSSIILEPGLFAVFYPEDFHRPGRSAGLSGTVRKLVVKIFFGG
ncbi:MAG: YhcH/YjgK/YiaL family protein [Candidatus Omnitrophota bacterium]